MRRGGGRRLPKPSLAPSNAAEATPALDGSVIRNLDFDSAFSRRDSDAASLCSSRPASTIGGAGIGAAAPNLSDRATQSAALRFVNGFLAPAVTLRGPLPSARDIQAALRLLVDRLRLPRNEATFEDDLIQDLRLFGCPNKVTRSALKAPGTPHSWPVLLSVLHWLTLLCYCQENDLDIGDLSNDLLIYTTQSYSQFLSGDDAAVAAIDEEYGAKAQMTGEASLGTVQDLEKEAEELETEVNQLISTTQRGALESEKEAFIADINKFEAVADTWKTKIGEREEVLGNLEKELEAKVLDTQRAAAEVQDLLKQVDAQPMNVRDMDRMRREMQATGDDISNAEKRKAALEDKVWEVEAMLVTKLEELERLAEKCNQALKRLKPAVNFEYKINSKGSSPAEMLGTGYKGVLKPALVAFAEENNRTCLSNLENLNDLQKQLQANVKVLEEERHDISSLQAKNDEVVARLNSLDLEIRNDDSRFTSQAGQMKDELEKKKNSLISLEERGDDFVKVSEERLQAAKLQSEEEIQLAAQDLLEFLDFMAEHKELMESTIAQRRRELYETADYIAGLFAGNSTEPDT